jgi:ABC-type transporter Mla subunit MlaD
MAAFADKLDKLLGGQVGQARELQQQTVTALAQSVTAFESMARQISDTGTAATTAMSSQLDKAMVEMADAQQQMNTTMRSFVDEMRSAMRAAQEDTQGGIAQMLSALSAQVDGALQAMSQQSAVATVAHEQQLGRISQSTSSALDELANLVRDQTAALQQATSTMRSAVSELGASVDRNIAKMGQGAEQMRQAADAFSGSGRAIADVFDRSRVVSAELSQVATQLSASSNDVQAVVGDYRAARESFVSLVEGLRGTVDTAKREVALTQDLVGRLESAAQKLFAAQGHADGYLDKLNQVLAEAHGAFSSQMLNTVRTTNGEFHDSLRKATGLLATTIVEFENALGDNTPRTRRAAS